MSSPIAKRNLSGVNLLLGATVIAGVAGYVVTWLVYRQVGAAPYAVFIMFWSALYLVVGGLAGIQQEITRATHVIEPGSRSRANRARNFGIVGAVVVTLIVLASSPLWLAAVFPDEGFALAIPLALGTGSYVLVATLSGSLYGVRQWGSLAMLISADGVLRLVLLVIALAFTRDLVTLAWTVVLPFPLVILLLWPFIRSGFVGRSDIDVGYRALSWNVARTVLASASTAVLVSGFPLLIGVVGGDESASLVGELSFTLTLTRAPLIVTVMALQSYLVVRFRDDVTRLGATMIRILALVAGVGLVLSVLGLTLGPWGFHLISGRPVELSGALIAAMVGSSVLVAALTVSGSALLASGRHFIYSIGWAAAAVATIVTISLPIPFLAAVTWALFVGPSIGLVVHLVWMGLASRRIGVAA